MAREGIQGVRRGKRRGTTRRDLAAARPPDLVDREFTATRPNELWVADLTEIVTWSGICYAAFVIDACSRMFVGWSAATHIRTELPLEALEMAIWRRDTVLDGLVHHSDAGSQYTSIRYTERLAEAGIAPSVGSVGDSYDNALAETMIGLIQDGVDRAPPPVAHPRAGGAGHAGVDRLVQQPEAPRLDRGRPAGRGRREVLRERGDRPGGGNPMTGPSTKPGAVHSGVH
jgi:putative transposase